MDPTILILSNNCYKVCSGVEHMWILAQTKSKREKVAEFNVINQGFKAFLPTIATKKFFNSQWKDSKEYLFPGYIFINLKGNIDKLGSLSYTTGILKVLVDRITGNPHVIEQEIIDRITNKKSLTINNIKKGSKINITKGTSVLNGVFLEKRGTKRALILLDILNQSRAVSVNYSDIQPVYY